MKGISIFATILALLVSAACDVVRGQDFKTDGLLADFAHLKQEMSAHYANLEWAAQGNIRVAKNVSARGDLGKSKARLFAGRRRALIVSTKYSSVCEARFASRYAVESLSFLSEPLQIS